MNRTPAALAASIALPCWRARCPTSLPETSRSFPAPANASRSEIGEGLDAASGGDDLLGRDAAVQQGLDGQPTQVAGGAGDDDRHGECSFML
jgi:hypothetical protein